jgi:hypothetical protein
MPSGCQKKNNIREATVRATAEITTEFEVLAAGPELVM